MNTAASDVLEREEKYGASGQVLRGRVMGAHGNMLLETMKVRVMLVMI